MLTLVKNSHVKTDMAVKFQCKAEGHHDFAYEFEADVNENKLDDQDFIIDHIEVHRTIERVLNTHMGSCERLCLNVESAVRELLINHGVHIYQMRLAIIPINNTVTGEKANAYVKLKTDYVNNEPIRRSGFQQ